MKPRRACTERSRSPALERSEGIDFQKSTSLCRNLNFDLHIIQAR